SPARLPGTALPGGRPRHLDVRLQGSADWRPLWVNLTSAASRLNLEQLCLDVNAPALHEGYHARWQRSDDELELPRLWRAEIPLPAPGPARGPRAVARPPDPGPGGGNSAPPPPAPEAIAGRLP